MESITRNWSIKRFIILIFLSLPIIFAIGCGQSPSVVDITPAAPTPAPPENFFPAAFADFKLTNTPKYDTELSKKCACQHFGSTYFNGNIAGEYQIEIYKSPEEARQAFEAKKYLANSAEVTQKSETDLTAIIKLNGGATTARIAGANLIIVGGRKTAVVVIENNLPYQTFGIAKPPPRKIEEFLETSVPASVVQKEFETNQAEAAKKYGGNFVLLKGKVTDSGDEVETKNITEKTPANRTTSTTPTPYQRIRRTSKYTRNRRTVDSIQNSFRSTPTPKKTGTPRTVEVHHPFVVLTLSDKGAEPIEIWCYFDSSEVKKVMEIKSEQEILLRGQITFVEGKIQISNARIEDSKDEGVKR